MDHPRAHPDADALCREALEFCSRNGAHPMAQALRRNALAVSVGHDLDKLQQLRLLLSQAAAIPQP